MYLSTVERISQIVCYIVLGLLILISNFPIFYVVVLKRCLVKRYAVILVLFLNCILTGINSFIRAYYEIEAFFKGEITGLSAITCLKRFAVLVDLYCFPMIGVCWITLGCDRLLVVCSPLSYFRHQKYHMMVQLIVPHVFMIAVMTVTVIISANNDQHNATSQCRQYEYLPETVYTVLVLLRLETSASFCSLVPIILILLKKYTKKIAKNETDQKVTSFMKRQHTFTRGTLFCCIYTFVLYVIPNIVAAVAHITHSPYLDNITVYTRIVTYLNPLPVAYVVFTTQPEIRNSCFETIPFLAKIPMIKHLRNEVQEVTPSTKATKI